MASERTYGNTSSMENTRRIKYGNIVQPINDHHQLVYPPDCITCSKHKGKIPTNATCSMICGNQAQIASANRRSYLNAKAKQTTLNKGELNELRYNND
jgi:hypothetical protein